MRSSWPAIQAKTSAKRGASRKVSISLSAGKPPSFIETMDSTVCSECWKMGANNPIMSPGSTKFTICLLPSSSVLYFTAHPSSTKNICFCKRPSSIIRTPGSTTSRSVIRFSANSKSLALSNSSFFIRYIHGDCIISYLFVLYRIDTDTSLMKISDFPSDYNPTSHTQWMWIAGKSHASNHPPVLSVISAKNYLAIVILGTPIRGMSVTVI